MRPLTTKPLIKRKHRLRIARDKVGDGYLLSLTKLEITGPRGSHIITVFFEK